MSAEPALVPEQDEGKLRQQVVVALKGVYDPEIPVDICALGLIYEINIYPIQNIDITMTLTSPNCPVAEELPEQVREAVLALPTVSDVQITLTFDPPYDQDMMSEAARLELGFM